MDRMTLRPLGVGQMLDRSFQVYRRLFTPLFLLTLIAFGPAYLLSNVLLVNVGALPLVPEFRFDDMDRFWMSRFPEAFFDGGLALWLKITGMIVLVLVLLFLVLPVYVAAAVILTNQTLNGEEASISGALREAWKKYGRVLGNCMLYLLLSIGVYMGVSMVMGIASLMYGGVAMSSAAISGSDAAVSVASISFLIVYIVVTYGGMIVYYYFLIRFGYFLPPVLFEGEGIGLGRSWILTRRGFWRLFAVYLIYGSLSYVFFVAFALVFAALGVSVTGLLLTLLIFCAVVPIGIVTYTLTYRVQQIRNDAEDVEALLIRLKGPQAPETAAAEA